MLTKFKLVEITLIEEEEINENTFDFEVEDDHSYIANDLVVHNSACTTRKLSGVGRSQLSTIIDCSEAAYDVGGMICSDGGCTTPGDVAKAFCGGSHFTMLGGMLAAHSESELELVDGKYKFFGMSSEEAMKQYSGGVAKHRAAEGKLVLLNDRGPVENTILEILGGLRSCGSYINCNKLQYFSYNAVFYRVTMQTNDVYGKS
jgi:GMP reductase